MSTVTAEIAEIRTTAGWGNYESTIAEKVDNGDLTEEAAALAALPGTSVDYLLLDIERADQLAVIEEVEAQEPMAIATVDDTADERYRITRRDVTLSVQDAVEILREEYAGSWGRTMNGQGESGTLKAECIEHGPQARSVRVYGDRHGCPVCHRELVPSQGHRTHWKHRATRCAVEGCERTRVKGRSTCSYVDHYALGRPLAGAGRIEPIPAAAVADLRARREAARVSA